MQTLTSSLIINLERAGDRLSESDLKEVLAEYKRRQADILARRAREKKELDERLQARLEGQKGQKGQVIEDDLDVSDDEDLLRQYGDMMVRQSLDEELVNVIFDHNLTRPLKFVRSDRFTPFGKLRIYFFFSW